MVQTIIVNVSIDIVCPGNHKCTMEGTLYRTIDIFTEGLEVEAAHMIFAVLLIVYCWRPVLFRLH